jgi:hypothetical protein
VTKPVSIAGGEFRGLTQGAEPAWSMQPDTRPGVILHSRQAALAHSLLAQITRGCLMSLFKRVIAELMRIALVSVFAVNPAGAPLSVTVKGNMRPRAKPQVERS